MKKLAILMLTITILIGCSKEKLTKIEYESVEEVIENVLPTSKEELNNRVYTILEDNLLEELIELGYNQEYPQNPKNGYTYLTRYLVENEMYCDDLYLTLQVSECEIDDYTLAPMRTYYEKYSKTEEFQPGVVVKKQGDNYEIVAAYSTVKTDMIDNAADDITIVLNSEEGTDEYSQAMDRLYGVYHFNGGTKERNQFSLDKVELSYYQTQIEELSNMTPQEIVENYDEYREALEKINSAIDL